MTLARNGRGRAGMGVYNVQRVPSSPPFISLPISACPHYPTSSHCDSVGPIGRGCMSTRSCIHITLTIQQVRAELSRPPSPVALIGRGITACIFTAAHSEICIGGKMCGGLVPLCSAGVPDLYVACAEEKYKGTKEIAHTRPRQTSICV